MVLLRILLGCQDRIQQFQTTVHSWKDIKITTIILSLYFEIMVL